MMVYIVIATYDDFCRSCLLYASLSQEQAERAFVRYEGEQVHSGLELLALELDKDLDPLSKDGFLT